MLRTVLIGLALCVSALGVAPLALGSGIPVFDAPLNSTAAVQLHQQVTTATQNVAQTLKQIDRKCCNLIVLASFRLRAPK
jgi:hypothetical protein